MNKMCSRYELEAEQDKHVLYPTEAPAGMERLEEKVEFSGYGGRRMNTHPATFVEDPHYLSLLANANHECLKLP